MSSTTSSTLSHTARRQRGAALIVAMVILVLLASAVLLDRLNAAVAPSPSRDPASVTALANAKQALIAWAATHPGTPGLLPFPDRNDDGAYDGLADCVSPGPVAAGHLLGRFPIQGEQTASGCVADFDMSVEVVDSGGAPLWYAVSRNLVGGGGGGPINPDIGDLAAQPWITVRDQNGAVISNRVAAVIIAPGPALTGQNRLAIDTDPLVEYPRYLDSITIGADTFDNADADGCLDDNGGCGTPESEDFIIYPTTADVFNDRLVYITIDELMRAVEDRVLGVAALTLKTYRDNGGVNLYPWLAPFTKPRVFQGIATGGSTTTLVDSAANFLAAPAVEEGYIVRNLSDGSIGTVAAGGVTATTLTLNGFDSSVGGGSIGAGDAYVVHDPTKYQGKAPQVEGLLPVRYPGDLIWTGFTVQWNFSDEDQDTGGASTPRPDSDDVDHFDYNPLTVEPGDGVCLKTPSNRVDCRGTAVLPTGGVGGSKRTVEVFFNFTADTTTIVPPSATDVRRRNHTFDDDYEAPIGPVTPNPVLFPSGQVWSVRITDDDGLGNVGWRTAEPDGDTDLDITFNGIRDDDLDPLSEMPNWFLDNNWHQFVHVAISGANLPNSATTSGTGTCVVPPAGDATNQCLTVRLNAAATPVDVLTNVDALVIGSGPALAGQDRNAGTPPCTSHPSFLCDYFETPNDDDEGASRNLVFGRALRDTLSVTATYNDQIRTVPP